MTDAAELKADIEELERIVPTLRTGNRPFVEARLATQRAALAKVCRSVEGEPWDPRSLACTRLHRRCITRLPLRATAAYPARCVNPIRLCTVPLTRHGVRPQGTASPAIFAYK